MSVRPAPVVAVVRLLRLAGLALRLLVRDWRAGELRLMALSVVVAVASFTAVAFFADRVRLALSQEASQLLGADLVVASEQPPDPALQGLARDMGLRTAHSVRFPSMAAAGTASVLVEVKAVGEGYPLRGRMSVVQEDGGTRVVTGPPAAGTAWLDERALARLGLVPGGQVSLGDRRFRVAGRISADPEASIGFLNLAPRVVVAEADLASTGLVQPGSRIRWRFMVAGAPAAVDGFRAALGPRLGPGQRVEDVREARPELRSALERAERFLGLASLLAAVLAAVAVALSARRYARRHTDHCAMLRCLGASRSATVGLHAVQVATVGLAAGVAGSLAGFAAQAVLAGLLAPMVEVPLPPPGVLPALQGVMAGLVMLAGFALPPLVSLGRVPALRVLRRDLSAPGGAGLAAHAAGLGAVAALVFWHAGEARLGGLVLGGLALGGLAAAALAAVLVRVAASAGRRAGFAWRFGLANLGRRASGSVVQVVALGTGLLALLLLSVTRADLLEGWRQSLPREAPNRFLVNVQPEQLEPLRQFFAAEALPAPVFHPMVRARLVAIGGRAVSAASYADERARRLVDREFNLSWANRLHDDNRILAGNWWGGGAAAPAQFSVEKGIADALGIRVGDMLTYQVAGTRVEAPVTSLRHVAWDSFRVNFFVLAPPGLLEGQPATWVTSFHLAPGAGAVMDRLVQRFPNLLVIDVAAVLAQVQSMVEQVVRAVEFLFLFSLAAGVLVLLAAIQATHDERVREAALLRALGAAAGRVRRAQLAEFLVVGALAGAFAAVGASGLGWLLARQVLSLPYTVNPWLWPAGLVAGAAVVALAGLAGTRGVLRVSPMAVLRRD